MPDGANALAVALAWLLGAVIAFCCLALIVTFITWIAWLTVRDLNRRQAMLDLRSDRNEEHADAQ